MVEDSEASQMNVIKPRRLAQAQGQSRLSRQNNGKGERLPGMSVSLRDPQIWEQNPTLLLTLALGKLFDL